MELSVLTESDILIFARTKAGKVSVFTSNNNIQSVIHDLQHLPDSAELRDNASVYKACFGTDLRSSKATAGGPQPGGHSKRKSGSQCARSPHHSKMKRLDSSGASSASQFDSDSDQEASDDQWARTQPKYEADPQDEQLKEGASAHQLPSSFLTGSSKPAGGDTQLPIAPLQMPGEQGVGRGPAGLDGVLVAAARNERIACIANQLAMEVAVGNVSQDKLLGVVETLQSLQVDPQQVITLVLLALPGAQEKARQLGLGGAQPSPTVFNPPNTPTLKP